MKRAAIYARYSSDLQTDRSIEDQIALCSDYAAKQGLRVVAVFDDKARSGASIMGRDGILSLMDAARDKAFDVVVVEALDRISRDQEDLAGIYKRLTHVGVEIRAVHEGRADIVQIGIRGLVGALFLQDLAHKVRRGMSGVVREGRSAGGRAYGYAPVPGRPGELVIVPDEAAIVLRIFEEYAAGRTPRDIAGDLNAENLAPPRGGYWQASTINGSRQRANGILQNPIYDGRIIWNRIRMMKDPDTGKRISRVNPSSEWQEQAVPDLRIVPGELFAAAAARRTRSSFQKPLVRQHRVLSGLLRCGACGSGMSIKDKMGRVTRIMCTRAKESKACSNSRPYVLDEIEATVISGLRDNLKNRELIEYYVAVYNEEHRRLYSGQGAEREKAAQRLGAAQREYDRVLNLVIKGVISEDEAAAKLPELRAERAKLEGILSTIHEAPKVVSLRPALVNRYLCSLEMLEAAVASADDLADEIKQHVRDLVTTVTVQPTASGQKPVIKVDGLLSKMVGFEDAPHTAIRGGRVVAGEGLEPPTPGL